MASAMSDGARISYQSEGQGIPLFLLCGFPQSIQDWYECGYVDALSNDFRLLLMDPRGQGLSDAPHEPEAYSAARIVGDVLAVLDAEGVQQRNGSWNGAMADWITLGPASAAQHHFLTARRAARPVAPRGRIRL